jgi:chitodextrinase
MAADAVIYRCYVGGVLAETAPAPTFRLDSLTPGTAYSVTITGVDDSGNESTLSSALVVTTLGATSATRQRSLTGVGS